ncbi:MAG: hypothetical protein HY908_26720 [Myxococcales bacterium]|nr:hypothetical protein [Myxococcales bacterium]
MQIRSVLGWLGLALAAPAAPLACGRTPLGGAPHDDGSGGAGAAAGQAPGGDAPGGDAPGGGGAGPMFETNCANGLDDDGDGPIDCLDGDCAADPGCQPAVETACANGLDDDGDGPIDCLDGDCAADPACQPAVETACANGLDDDTDGHVDCADPDCAGVGACGASGWTCGQILTCAQACGPDFACVSTCQAAGCASGQTAFGALQQCLVANCLTECAGDPGGPACQSCMSTACGGVVTACLADACQGAVELACEDGQDNDADGAVDCADSDCVFHPSCQGLVETACTNAQDDDGDGPVDCADSDCVGTPSCGGSLWRCSQILVCTQACAGDFACIAACEANGCATAQAAFQAMQNCLMLHCLGECAATPGSAACQACMQTACGPETSACLANTCQGGGTESDCANAWDDDADGAVDCADSDCVAAPSCQGLVETNCIDGLDDDGDGPVDCADPDCAADQACVGVGATCSEVMSCAQGCGGDLACTMACQAAGCPTAQVLYDAVESCLANQCLAACVGDPGGAGCQSCMVANCAAELAACVADDCQGVGSEVSCADGVDHDADGATDCADPDCFASPDCAGQVELDCANGLDDDGDGPADCADPDCAADPSCGPGTTCGEVLVCAEGCGLGLGCLWNCRSDACPSGQSAWDDVQLCLLGSCLLDCLQGPGSPDCQSCMLASCPAELATCITDDCG